MTQQQKKKEDETLKKTAQKKRSTNPLMAAFKKDRNTPESLEKLRNDAALKSINKGRSNRGQKPLDKLPTTLAKASAARLKTKKPKPKPTSKSTGTGKGIGKGTGTGTGTKLKVNTTDKYIPKVHKPGDPFTEEGVLNPNYKPEERDEPLW